jgi:hypothetical protein
MSEGANDPKTIKLQYNRTSMNIGNLTRKALDIAIYALRDLSSRANEAGCVIQELQEGAVLSISYRQSTGFLEYKTVCRAMIVIQRRRLDKNNKPK